MVALALMFRFYDIQHYPPGLFPDQAANGEDALLILDGDWRPFYERGNGREALFFYAQALSIKYLGIGVWQMFAVSAAVGVLTVLATYFATRPFFGRLAALLAAFFLATSYWHVTLSRTGFRAIQIPLFVAAFTAFTGYTIQSVKKKQLTASYIYAALAGAAFTGGFYTYIAYRVMIGVVLGVFVLLLLAAIHPKIGFPHFKRYGAHIIIAIIAGLITFAPLGWYFIEHPDAFIGRAGQVSVFNKQLQEEFGGGTLTGTLLYSTEETLKSFFTGQGDINWRHNVAGYPLLNPLVGLMFLLGLIWTLHGTVQVALSLIRGKEVHLGMIYPYFLLVLFGMLLPVITTAEGMPHGLRSVGLIAPIFILAGTAAAVSYRWVLRWVGKGLPRSLASGVVIGLLILSAVYDGVLYFGITRNDSGAAYAYRADLTDVSNYINQYKKDHPNETRPYLVLDKFSIQTVHFLTHTLSGNTSFPPPHDYQDHPDEAEHLYTYLNPVDSYLTPLKAGEVIIFTQSTLPDADKYQQTYGNSLELIESRHNRWHQEIMRVYRAVKDGTPKANQVEEFNLDA